MIYNFCKFQINFIETEDIIHVNVLLGTYFIFSYQKTMKHFIHCRDSRGFHGGFYGGFHGGFHGGFYGMFHRGFHKGFHGGS